MTAAAVELGRKLRYEGAGTAEFILDEKTKKFYFLELNTRLQVEHPITEAISGLDLVELQILELGILDQISFKGHAIECRLCAEDPDHEFEPRTGVIRKWSTADAGTKMTGVRYDTGIEDGSEISVYYDSMIAKVIVHAATRAEAVRRMVSVLARTVILGVTTNQKFLIDIMKNPRFQSGTFDTNFISQESARLFYNKSTSHIQNSAIAALLFDWKVRQNQQVHLRNIPPGWRNVRWKTPSTQFLLEEESIEIKYGYQGQVDQNSHHFVCDVVFKEEPIENIKVVLSEAKISCGAELPGPGGIEGANGMLRVAINDSQHYFYVASDVFDINKKSIFVHDFIQGHQVELVKLDRLKSISSLSEDDRVTPYTSSMPCRILKILASSGTIVKKNDPLLSIESMKTEIKILSRHEGVLTVRVEENQLVDARVLLCQVDEINPSQPKS
ncbi:hypothetical protein DFQ28_010145 [Apophysomyces sp. BC1034]|nr:hypothetical protein DFQ28_010145 [Apophysomyces sp. BC1034]